ncbi:MAG TPA: BON domain-containing protein [Candidatus Saccharimonadia bacterium]|nr:BON domain-containing protein [Candidatus Saccharimonadia bacterium]
MTTRTLNSTALNKLPLALAALAFAGAACAESDTQPGEGANEPQPKSEPTVADARREAQIWTSYAFNPHLRASDISVEVRGDRAYLTGTVDEGVDKELAEQIAKGVEGVARVDNDLVIDADYQPKARDANADRDFATTVEDATITASVKSKLLWNDHTDGLEIDVDTKAGRVTLSGTADTEQAKHIAVRLARNTDGVVSVDNKLTLDTDRATAAVGTADDGDDDGDEDKVAATDRDGDGDADPAQAQVTDGWISTKVKSTLLLSRWVDGMDIDVDTKEGAVKLTGTADSAAERDLAVELAQNIRGVRSVDAAALKVGAEADLADVDDD